MFFELSPTEEKIDKTDANLQEITTQIEALQEEINTFIQKHDSSHGTPTYTKNISQEDFETFKQKLEDIKSTSISLKNVKSSLSERNVPQHWLFVR